jgi:hypothetical protein
MVEQSPAQASLAQKLEAFAAGLTDEERQVLGQLLAPAIDAQPNADEIQGYALFDASTPALFQAVSGGGTGLLGTEIKLGLLRPGSVGVIAGRAAR